MKRKYAITEVSREIGVDREFILRCVRSEWVSPFSPESEEFDDEDLTRVRLIRELLENLGVNDESVPIILHLLDQIHALRGRLRRTTDPSASPWG